MQRESNPTRPGRRPDKKASASSKLFAAVSLLGVSLGVSAAAIPDGAGPAAGAKSAAAGEKLAQSNQLKIKPVQSNQLKIKPPSKSSGGINAKARKPRRR